MAARKTCRGVFMRRICLGVFLITMATLAIELLLTRVFDVILNYNLSYFIVTSAVFAIGLAGIYASLRPLEPCCRWRC